MLLRHYAHTGYIDYACFIAIAPPLLAYVALTLLLPLLPHNITSLRLPLNIFICFISLPHYGIADTAAFHYCYAATPLMPPAAITATHDIEGHAIFIDCAPPRRPCHDAYYALRYDYAG